MEIQSSEVASKTAKEFAMEILAVQLQKKELDKTIKEIKSNFKEDGCAVGTVTGILSKMKARAKKSEGDLLEEEILTESMEADKTIVDMINQLNAD